jgi:hypothetical protein
MENSDCDDKEYQVEERVPVKKKTRTYRGTAMKVAGKIKKDFEIPMACIE